MMSFDVARARNETPGCENVVHLNNAGASLMPAPVADAVIEHVRLETRTGGYEAAAEAGQRIEHTYDALASLLTCHRDEVAVLDNATRAWQMAFYAVPMAPGDRVLTSRASYASNYISFLHRARRDGITVDVVGTDRHGQVDVAELRDAVDEDVKLIALTHVPTNGGLVNPAPAVGRLAKEAGIPFLLDACQSAGQMPLDVDALGVDMLSATSRKFLRGPRGMGFLYVRRRWLERLAPPLPDLHAATWQSPTSYHVRDDARRFETWETNVAAKIGLGVAVDYALRWGLDAIWDRVRHLGDAMRRALTDVPGVTVHDRGRIRCGIVSFSVKGVPAAAVKRHLGRHRVNVSVSEPSSTLLDAEARHLPDLVRASVHYFNSEDEVTRLCALVEACPRP